ncbi:MAG: DUF1846 domain-containing protein [Lentisphaeria bacterium]|nr:DUF1846 domain-containing protein [Lentisphaeria bacterium]
MTPVGFDNDKYLEEQSRAILDRAAQFDNKLYLEFGGKLAQDCHAARILPGFDPNVKLRLLQKLKEKIDIVICIYAGDIERKKIRADFGISYDADTLRIIDMLRSLDISVRAVVVTRYAGQPAVKAFINKLTRFGIRVYTHRAIPGYPTDLDMIVSDEGYGSNAYIETERPIVIVTGPGPSSGKMATCLSQVYHEQKRGIRAGYAKFETFPVWNLPLKHPVNLAYEAATADIGDINMVDPFHLEAYGETATNYNRDVEVFPVVRRICAKMMSPEQLYRSPTDMGVNRVGFCISDDNVVRQASNQEVIRRWFRYQCEYLLGSVDNATMERVKLLMGELGITEEDRPVVAPARATAQSIRRETEDDSSLELCGAALQLPDGRIITGKNSPLLHSAAACVINAIKTLAGLPDELLLIAPDVITSVGKMKKEYLKSRRVSLDLGEALIALSVSVPGNPAAQLALQQLSKLSGCEMHLTHLPSPGDEGGLRKLGINLTSEPKIAGSELFMD